MSLDNYAEKDARYFGKVGTDIAPVLPCAPGQKLGRVLELGCANGATMSWLRATYGVEHATGIELMPASADLARSTFDRMIVGSVESPTALDDIPPVDLILALDVLEHLAYPQMVVSRLEQLLRPGGAFIVSLPNIGHYSVAMPLLLKGRWKYEDEGILDRTHLRFFDEAGARALIGAGDMRVDRVSEVRVVQFLNFPPFARNRWLRWYANRMLQVVLPRHLLIYQFLLRARRLEFPTLPEHNVR